MKNIVSDLRMFTHPSTDSLDQVVVSEVVASALRFLSNEVKDKALIEQKLPAEQTVLGQQEQAHPRVREFDPELAGCPAHQALSQRRAAHHLDRRPRGKWQQLPDRPRQRPRHCPLIIVDKIYDPFFTTKDVGEGMGLGLSICYRIMQDSQGKISVRTENGKVLRIYAGVSRAQT